MQREGREPYLGREIIHDRHLQLHAPLINRGYERLVALATRHTLRSSIILVLALLF